MLYHLQKTILGDFEITFTKLLQLHPIRYTVKDEEHAKNYYHKTLQTEIHDYLINYRSDMFNKMLYVKYNRTEKDTNNIQLAEKILTSLSGIKVHSRFCKNLQENLDVFVEILPPDTDKDYNDLKDKLNTITKYLSLTITKS